MSDSIHLLPRLLYLLFLVVMLVFPLASVLFTRNRAPGDGERTVARLRLLVLGVATLLALAVAGALVVAGTKWPESGLQQASKLSWILFFPLWFGLAMPAIRARNGVWSGALDGRTAATSERRAASLVNRSRESPISTGAWAIFATVVVGALLVVAARGLVPFAEEATDGAARHRQWLIATATFACCTMLTLLVVPFAIRRTQEEPEPLDPSGSAELVELYRAQRFRRTRLLFWLLGVGLPGFMGAVIAAMVWAPPGSGVTIGLVGGIVGSLFGLAGAVVGCWMAIERVRIAEVKARLEAAHAARTS